MISSKTLPFLVAALLAAPLALEAQAHGPTKTASPGQQVTSPSTAALDTIPAPVEAKGNADYIMPHLTDSKHLELPCVKNWKEWA